MHAEYACSIGENKVTACCIPSAYVLYLLCGGPDVTIVIFFQHEKKEEKKVVPRANVAGTDISG